MRNHTSQLVPRVKHNPIRTRRATTVDASRAQDRPFLVGAGDGEVEALVVVVAVGVAVAANALAVRVQLVAGVLGGVDGAGRVAVAAAGVVAGTGERLRYGLGGGEGAGEEEGGEGEDL